MRNIRGTFRYAYDRASAALANRMIGASNLGKYFDTEPAGTSTKKSDADLGRISYMRALLQGLGDMLTPRRVESNPQHSSIGGHTTPNHREADKFF